MILMNQLVESKQFTSNEKIQNIVKKVKLNQNSTMNLSWGYVAGLSWTLEDEIGFMTYDTVNTNE